MVRTFFARTLGNYCERTGARSVDGEEGKKRTMLAWMLATGHYIHLVDRKRKPCFVPCDHSWPHHTPGNHNATSPAQEERKYF